MNKLTLQDFFESIKFNLSIPIRYSCILSNCLELDRARYKDELLNNHLEIVKSPSFAKPKELFDFLKANQNRALYFEDEILSKRIEYIRLLEGAICANDLDKPWSVNYVGDSFVFKGKIIIASRLNKEELKKREQLQYILRDTIVI
ncbi:hypothetical protein PZ892_10560 [Sphingobacterium sp. WM]|uniref:hypothetical protein n=1 Tax=Sphingobacterium sp. WM TaxID=3031802 RepID=UPI00240D3F2A|nr:hypothetical protein [Sphingobacterium sp. WM]WFB62122.1 hypothetical protein PZ892_10560 [Sphingobacterium sp. WM]